MMMNSNFRLVAAASFRTSTGWTASTNSIGSPHCRCITSRAARSLLGLPPSPKGAEALTLKELRFAYFAAAKKCHPDMKKNKPSQDDGTKEKEENDDGFLQLTRAYELLQGEITTTNNPDFFSMISADEEEDFRHACQMVLGLDAEIVEECKQSPTFRQWLIGRTDAAYHWRCFFLQHGGLAPKLSSGGRAMLTTGSSPLPSHTTRRKRK